jgi:hypothetical protein
MSISELLTNSANNAFFPHKCDFSHYVDHSDLFSEKNQLNELLKKTTLQNNFFNVEFGMKLVQGYLSENYRCVVKKSKLKIFFLQGIHNFTVVLKTQARTLSGAEAIAEINAIF